MSIGQNFPDFAKGLEGLSVKEQVGGFINLGTKFIRDQPEKYIENAQKCFEIARDLWEKLVLPIDEKAAIGRQLSDLQYRITTVAPPTITTLFSETLGGQGENLRDFENQLFAEKDPDKLLPLVQSRSFGSLFNRYHREDNLAGLFRLIALSYHAKVKLPQVVLDKINLAPQQFVEEAVKIVEGLEPEYREGAIRRLSRIIPEDFVDSFFRSLPHIHVIDTKSFDAFIFRHITRLEVGDVKNEKGLKKIEDAISSYSKKYPSEWIPAIHRLTEETRLNHAIRDQDLKIAEIMLKGAKSDATLHEKYKKIVRDHPAFAQKLLQSTQFRKEPLSIEPEQKTFAYSQVVGTLHKAIDEAREAASSSAGVSREKHLKEAERLFTLAENAVQTWQGLPPTSEEAQSTIFLLSKAAYKIKSVVDQGAVAKHSKFEWIKQFFVRQFLTFFKQDLQGPVQAVESIFFRQKELKKEVGGIYKDFFLTGDIGKVAAVRDEIIGAKERLNGIEGLPASYERRKQLLLAKLDGLEKSLSLFPREDIVDFQLTDALGNATRKDLPELVEGYKAAETAAQSKELPAVARARVDLALNLYKDKFHQIQKEGVPTDFGLAEAAYFVFDKDQESGKVFGELRAYHHAMKFSAFKGAVGPWPSGDGVKVFEAAYEKSLKALITGSTGEKKEERIKSLVDVYAKPETSEVEKRVLEKVLTKLSLPKAPSDFFMRKAALLGASDAVKEDPLKTIQHVIAFSVDEGASIDPKEERLLINALKESLQAFRAQEEIDAFRQQLLKYEANPAKKLLGEDGLRELKWMLRAVEKSLETWNVGRDFYLEAAQELTFEELTGLFVLRQSLPQQTPDGKPWTSESVRGFLGFPKPSGYFHSFFDKGEATLADVAKLMNSSQKTVLADASRAYLLEHYKTLAADPDHQTQEQARSLAVLKKGSTPVSEFYKIIKAKTDFFYDVQVQRWKNRYQQPTEEQATALEQLIAPSHFLPRKERPLTQGSEADLALPAFAKNEFNNLEGTYKELLTTEAEFMKNAAFILTDLSIADEAELNGEQIAQLADLRERIKEILELHGKIFQNAASFDKRALIDAVMSKNFIDALWGLIGIADVLRKVRTDRRLMEHLASIDRSIQSKEKNRDILELSKRMEVFQQRATKYHLLFKDMNKNVLNDDPLKEQIDDLVEATAETARAMNEYMSRES